MTKVILSAAVLAAIAVPALATPSGGPVPEIDAGAGVAALAALGASVALLRERFKR